MSRFRVTVPCSRPAEVAGVDEWNNTVGETRAVVAFTAAFFLPTNTTASQVVDGVLRETTITKPTLMVEPTTANAPAFVAGAIKSTDAIVVNGDDGWQVDGDPNDLFNIQSGKHHMLVIELRKKVGG